KEYWNRTAFVCEPTGHLAATFELQPSGTDFRARYGWNLVAADDEWAAPIMAEVGPDGNGWVIDWYAYIVQHNPAPPGWKTGKGAAYETELRDKTHGRIYRLVCKNAKPVEKITLKDATPEKLVATLKNDNMFWRLHAQRLLVERGETDVVASLAKLALEGPIDGVGLRVGAIHALWTGEGLGAIQGLNQDIAEPLITCQNDPSAAVRRTIALLVGSHMPLEKLVRGEKDPHVRLAVLLGMAEAL